MTEKTLDWQAEATVLFDTGNGQGLDDANDLLLRTGRSESSATVY